MRVLKLIWAGPASVIGLALAPFFDDRRVNDGVLICEGARWPKKLGWRYTAITLGHVVLSVVPMGEELLRHEMVHVRQYERWGPFMIPAYGLGSLVALGRGGHYYRDNPFERSARDH